MLTLLKEARRHGIQASYVLFDSWFSFPSTIMRVLKEEFHVIAMLKALRTVYYKIGDRAYHLEALFALSEKRQTSSDILSYLVVELGRDEDKSQY